MGSELKEEFDRYWSDRAPGMEAYTRYVLDHDTDFNHTLRLFIRNVSPGSKVIDMGTGCGVVALEMARMGFDVDAMDCNPDLIKAAEELADEMGLKVNFILGDVTEPGLSEKSYDIVLSRNCLWNLEDPIKAYSRWKGLLRPGG
jgi:2-polyprenyl-3-methyl-5-hydroxy-6-metoxy-1,4-benzoquinol methylase